MNENYLVDNVAPILSRVAYDSYRAGEINVDLMNAARQLIAELADQAGSTKIYNTIMASNFGDSLKHFDVLLIYVIKVLLKSGGEYAFNKIFGGSGDLRNIAKVQIGVTLVETILTEFVGIKK